MHSRKTQRLNDGGKRRNEGNFFNTQIWHDQGVEYSNTWDLNNLSKALHLKGKATHSSKHTRQRRCDAWTCAHMPSTCTPNACEWFQNLTQKILTTWVIHCHDYVTQNNLSRTTGTATTGFDNWPGVWPIWYHWRADIGKFVQSLDHWCSQADYDFQQAHIDSDLEFKQDYNILAQRFLMHPNHINPNRSGSVFSDLGPDLWKDHRMQESHPLVLMMHLHVTEDDAVITQNQREHIHLDIAKILSEIDLFVYEAVYEPHIQSDFCLCVTDVPPLRMSTFGPHIWWSGRGRWSPLDKGRNRRNNIHWLFRSVKFPKGVKYVESFDAPCPVWHFLCGTSAPLHWP